MLVKRAHPDTLAVKGKTRQFFVSAIKEILLCGNRQCLSAVLRRTTQLGESGCSGLGLVVIADPHEGDYFQNRELWKVRNSIEDKLYYKKLPSHF